MPPSGGILVQLLAFLGALALLVGNAAAGLAGGLAGGLAFAAAAVLGAVTQVTGLDGLDVFHGSHLPNQISSRSLYHNPGGVSIIFFTFFTFLTDGRRVTADHACTGCMKS